MNKVASFLTSAFAGSLKTRFILIAAVVLLFALTLSWVVLGQLFQRHVERRIDLELQNHIRQLAAQVTITKTGEVQVTGNLADPRFERAFSGLYWQVGLGTSTSPLRSASLLDAVLPLPDDVLEPDRVHRHQLPGPGGAELYVLERPLLYRHAGGVRRVRIAVAIDSQEIRQARREFASDLAVSLALLGSVLLLTAAVQVHFGLRPLEVVRRRVEDVSGGRARRLTGSFPSEVAPLASEMNALLGLQEKAVERARNQAGDLAHGLKTPLTVLKATARRLRNRNDAATADELDSLAATMSRHVDHVMARARTAVQPKGARTRFTPVLASVVQTLQRTPNGERVVWENSLDDATMMPMEAQDLTEVLGNVLENAARWARRRVCIEPAEYPAVTGFRISDDGPGLSAEQLEMLGCRGRKFDTSPASSGLGLAIARDIVAAYGGEMRFENAVGKGLAVEVLLPLTQEPDPVVT